MTSRISKNSLTFESVVCSQLELQRRAASFSHRRNTMCRRPSQCRLSSPTSPSSSNRLSFSSSNRVVLLSPISSQLSSPYPSSRTSTTTPSDSSTIQFIKTRSLSINKHNRASSPYSTNSDRIDSTIDRQSLGSLLYWDASSRRTTMKKVLFSMIINLEYVFLLFLQTGSRWSIDFPKETPFYWSLRSRLIEEYTESESLLEFAKETILVLMKTSNSNIYFKCSYVFFYNSAYL